MKKIIGIDISKATFDIAFCQNGKWKYFAFSNTLKGFKAFYKILENQDHCIMEASGPYYLQLASFLDENGITVSVVNPLVIKRFSQMRLLRAKTDKKDAQSIAEYGALENPKRWKRSKRSVLQMQQIMSLIDTIHKQKTALKNQLGAFTSSGVLDKQVNKSLKSLLLKLEKEQSKLEQRIDELIAVDYQETYSRLTTIPGIGKKAATMFIILTGDFTKFSNYKQLTAFVGFSPRIYESGTSVRGKGHICKMGQSQIRKILYLCSWTAKSCNKGCREMYDRLKLKGKPERVIKIAIANKLLKQAFAIGVGQGIYNENHVGNTCF